MDADPTLENMLTELLEVAEQDELFDRMDVLSNFCAVD